MSSPRGGASETKALEIPRTGGTPTKRTRGETKKQNNTKNTPADPPSRHPRNTVSLQCFSRKGGQGGSQEGRETCKMNCKITRDGRAGQKQNRQIQPNSPGELSAAAKKLKWSSQGEIQKVVFYR